MTAWQPSSSLVRGPFHNPARLTRSQHRWIQAQRGVRPQPSCPREQGLASAEDGAMADSAAAGPTAILEAGGATSTDAEAMAAVSPAAVPYKHLAETRRTV